MSGLMGISAKTGYQPRQLLRVVGCLVLGLTTLSAVAECELVNLPIPENDPQGLARSLSVDTTGADGVAVSIEFSSGLVGELSMTLSRQGVAEGIDLIADAGVFHFCSTYPFISTAEPFDGGPIDIILDDRTTIPVLELCRVENGMDPGARSGRFVPTDGIATLFDQGMANDVWQLKIVDSDLPMVGSNLGLATLVSWCVEPFVLPIDADEDDDAPEAASTGPFRPYFIGPPEQLPAGERTRIETNASYRYLANAADTDWIYWDKPITPSDRFPCREDFQGGGPRVLTVGVQPLSATGLRIETFSFADIATQSNPQPYETVEIGCGGSNRAVVATLDGLSRISPCDPALAVPLLYEVAAAPACTEGSAGPVSLLEGLVLVLGSGEPVPFALVQISNNVDTFSGPRSGGYRSIVAPGAGEAQAFAAGFFPSDILSFPSIAPGDSYSLDLPMQQAIAITSANLQFPATLSVQGGIPSASIFGQAFVPGLTDAQSQPVNEISAQLGFGPMGSEPDFCTWQWFDMVPNPGFDFSANRDEFVGTLVANNAGEYQFTTRWSGDGGRSWLNTDLDGFPYEAANAGVLTVTSSSSPIFDNGFEPCGAGPSQAN